MTCRITVEARTTSVEGLLDEPALAQVLARCRASSATRLLLRAGTVVHAECMAKLAQLELEVVAESPYLARWLTQARAERSSAL